MRTIHTFIVRLLLDPAEPEALRGALQVLPEGDPKPFGDGAGLLGLLRAAAATPPPAGPAHAPSASDQNTQGETP